MNISPPTNQPPTGRKGSQVPTINADKTQNNPIKKCFLVCAFFSPVGFFAWRADGWVNCSPCFQSTLSYCYNLSLLNSLTTLYLQYFVNKFTRQTENLILDFSAKRKRLTICNYPRPNHEKAICLLYCCGRKPAFTIL